MHVHPVFHASLLSPHYENHFSSRTPKPPPPVHYKDQDIPEFEVEEILDVRKRGRRWEWLVSWKGYGIGDRTWEPWPNLGRAKESVLRFHNYPSFETSTCIYQGADGKVNCGRGKEKGGT